MGAILMQATRVAGLARRAVAGGLMRVKRGRRYASLAPRSRSNSRSTLR